MQQPVEFHNFFSDIVDPMPADKSAMGGLPTAGFQYCEALTAASAHGYYVFPPCDATIRWDGDRFEMQMTDGWQRFSQVTLSEESLASWHRAAPPEHQDRLPPFLQRFFIPDTIQVFTGLFVTAAPGWAIKVRPIANVRGNSRFLIYEAIVEADLFKPVPLFVNIKALSIDAVFDFERFTPFLQIEPVQKDAYRKALAKTVHPGREDDASQFPWEIGRAHV